MNPEQIARALRVVQGNAEDVHRSVRNAHDYGAVIVRACAFPAVPQDLGENVSTVMLGGITLAGYLVETLALLPGFVLGGHRYSSPTDGRERDRHVGATDSGRDRLARIV